MKELEEEGGGFKMFEYDTNCTSSTRKLRNLSKLNKINVWFLVEFAMILCIVVTALVGIVCSGMLIKGTKEVDVNLKQLIYFASLANFFSENLERLSR